MTLPTTRAVTRQQAGPRGFRRGRGSRRVTPEWGVAPKERLNRAIRAALETSGAAAVVVDDLGAWIDRRIGPQQISLEPERCASPNPGVVKELVDALLLCAPRREDHGFGEPEGDWPPVRLTKDGIVT